MQKQKFVASLVVLIALAFLGWRFFTSDQFLEVRQSALEGVLNKIAGEISAPPPLFGTDDSPRAFLTQPGILAWTNAQRREVSGLPPLTESVKLDQVAASRLDDMFLKQYFDHVSPSGEDAGDVAGEYNYEYIAIGENLALGNFEDDRTVVQAWMDSPGHRANILNTRYKEIGISAKRGAWQGRETWIAVQIFGLPASACGKPDTALKTRIDSLKVQISSLGSSADELRARIEAMRPQTRAEREEYNQLVKEYNAMVRDINELISVVKGLISEYNRQIDVVNACIKGV